MRVLGSQKQALIVGATALQLNFSGNIQNANSDAAANTSVVDVNSTGRDISFNTFDIQTANADFAFDLVAGNFVALNDCDLALIGVTVPMGANAPRVARNVGGFRTENEGIATILNGNSSVTVNHGLFTNPGCILVVGRNHGEVKDCFVSRERSTCPSPSLPIGKSIGAQPASLVKRSKEVLYDRSR